MTESEKLSSFISAIEHDPATRSSFLRDPLGTMKAELQLNTKADAAALSLGTQLALDLMQDPMSLKQIDEICSARDSLLMDEKTARSKIASCVFNAASPPVRLALEEKWKDEDGVAGPDALANLVIAVDVAAVATKVAVHHQDAVVNQTYFFNGKNIRDNNDLIRITKLLSIGLK